MRPLDWPSVIRMFAQAVGKLPAGQLWFLLKKMRNEKLHRFDGQKRINSFFPQHPSPAFDRFLSAVIERRRVPYSCYLAVTGRCPFRCEHCSYGRRGEGELPAAAWREILAQLKAIGGCTVGFTGGEPLLREDLEELIAAAGPELNTIVFSTGWGLTQQRARAMKAAGLGCLTIGIESAEAEPHDRTRGAAGSFEQAAEAVRLAQAAGIYTAISTVGTTGRIASGELEAMYRLAAAWGAGEFRLLSPVATGSAAGQADIMLCPDDVAALREFHIRHNRRAGGPAVASFAYLESPELFGCGAGFHHLFIDSLGEVCPCDLTPLSLGNVTQEPLAEIWRQMGDIFARPRCRCLMREVAEAIPLAGPLPLPRRQSEQLCRSAGGSDALPGAYQRLGDMKTHMPSSQTSAAAARPMRKTSA